MRILIAEDNSSSAKFMQKYMSFYGECDLVVDGLELVDAFVLGEQEKKPYDLICIDIILPKVDGVTALKGIRHWEQQHGYLPSRRAKIIMTTALSQGQYRKDADEYGCNGYISKPIDINQLDELLTKLGFEKKATVIKE